jgi:hypothetical protein
MFQGTDWDERPWRVLSVVKEWTMSGGQDMIPIHQREHQAVQQEDIVQLDQNFSPIQQELGSPVLQKLETH